MGPNPNHVAVGISVILGILVIFWNATLKRMTGMEFMLVLGAIYMTLGTAHFILGGPHRPTTRAAIGVALLTGVLYASSFIAMNYVFGHPNVNLPLATAITAAYPVVTAVTAFIFMGQRFTIREAVFFCMAVGGVVGLGLSGKQSWNFWER